MCNCDVAKKDSTTAGQGAASRLGALAGLTTGQAAASDGLTLKAGSVIQVGGFPFRLVRDTAVEGVQANMIRGAAERFALAAGAYNGDAARGY